MAHKQAVAWTRTVMTKLSAQRVRLFLERESHSCLLDMR
jgi:hypothetical protein